MINKAQAPLAIRLKRNLKLQDNGCLVWTGYVKPSGYAGISLGKVAAGQDLIHRVAYKLKYGEIPTGSVIDHLCGNRICANPDHLEAVTQKENVHRSKKSKLTQKQANDIRKIYKKGNLSQRKIAEIYGVSKSNISRIIVDLQWVAS